MNPFEQYGIKEVANVTFFSKEIIGDLVIPTPVLFLDTLKISTAEQTGEKVAARGGYGNSKLMSWSFGKEITVKLEDALFSPASLSLALGGKLNFKMGYYTGVITKANVANIYGKSHYSIKAYPSPTLLDEEWEIVFAAAQEIGFDSGSTNTNPTIYVANPSTTPEDAAFIAENRQLVKNMYYKRTISITEGTDTYKIAMNTDLIDAVNENITKITDIGQIETSIKKIEKIDRFEKCIVKERSGLKIKTSTQKENLFKMFQDSYSNYTVYYDTKTMLPLFKLNDGTIDETDDIFTLPIGTSYYKKTRTVLNKAGVSLGRRFSINPDTFPDNYMVEGETFIKDAETGQDIRMKFRINSAAVSSNTTINMAADGEPTVFSMDLEVLTPENGEMFELDTFDAVEDYNEGGTRVLPQKDLIQSTNVEVTMIELEADNDEIY